MQNILFYYAVQPTARITTQVDC